MRNENGLKDSIDCYRNIKIKGKKIKFEQWTWNTEEFQSEREEAKELGLRTRIINGEMYREVK